MAFYIDDYPNPHISVRGTLDMLGTTSEYEVDYENERLMAEERAGELDAINAEHHAYESILDKFERFPSVEGSLVICWQPLSVVKRARKHNVSQDEIDAILENQKSYLPRLQKIVSREKSRLDLDDYVSDEDASIFIHLSVGIVLLSRLVEQSQTEQQWEWTRDTLRVINMPKTESLAPPFYEQTRFPRTIPLSYKMAKALIWSMSASRFFADYKYEEALQCYGEVVALFSEANESILGWLEYGDALSDEARHYELIPDNDGIGMNLLEDESGALEPTIVYDFSTSLFCLERAVKAFDALIDEDSRDTNWTRVADHCRYFAKNWHLLSIPVESRHIPEQDSVGESWIIAHGIVLNRMSNDDRIKELHRNRDSQIEDRLRLYFFGNSWDNIPDIARAALISADREYENTHGWRPGIFENLCRATREILVEVLVKPYNEYRSTQKKLKSLVALAPAPSEYESLYDTVQQLYYAPLFENFLKQSFNSKDRNFIKGLESTITEELNRLRNDAVHDHRRMLQSFERDIRETYAEFLGIGRPGVLPHLMRLHPKDKLSSRK